MEFSKCIWWETRIFFFLALFEKCVWLETNLELQIDCCFKPWCKHIPDVYVIMYPILKKETSQMLNEKQLMVYINW